MKRQKPPIEYLGLALLLVATVLALVPDLAISIVGSFVELRNEEALTNTIQSIAFFGVILLLMAEGVVMRSRRP